MINFFSEDIDFAFGEKRQAKLRIKKLIESENRKSGNVSFIFCSDEYLLTMNNKYLNHNYFTDVITFDYTECDTVSGDIYISIDRVRENAMEFNVSFEQELNRVIYHGILHLCGYKDKTADEEQLMRTKENYYLDIL